MKDFSDQLDPIGVEPMASSLQEKRSTIELRALLVRTTGFEPVKCTVLSRMPLTRLGYARFGGDDGVRTRSLQIKSLTLCPLSYTPLEPRGGRTHNHLVKSQALCRLS